MSGKTDDPVSFTETTIESSDGESLRYRRLAPGDEAALRQFHDKLSPSSKSLFTPHGYDTVLLRNYVERNQLGIDRSYVLIAAASTIVGYFFLWDFSLPAPSLGIGIADDWQDKKLGPKMLRILIDDARAAGKQGIELTTVIDNHRAFALYRKMGFEHHGEVENIAGDGRIVVEKRMFLALKEGARPTDREFRPPV